MRFVLIFFIPWPFSHILRTLSAPIPNIDPASYFRPLGVNLSGASIATTALPPASHKETLGNNRTAYLMLFII
eukprot:scaffold195618_cov28-Tisochrysis_lutea.AAC.1